MMNICTIIILYQKKIVNSTSFMTLKNQNTNIIIFDNSTSETMIEFNRSYCSENGLEYYGFGTNFGIAYAYNFVISNSMFNYYLTADDDSYFEDNYIKKMENSFEKEILVYLPKVINNSNGIQMSPQNYYNKYLSNFNRTKKELKNKGYYKAINSGVIYHKNIFKNVKFDENLFVENIDHKIFDDLKRKKIIQRYVPSLLEQNFSTLAERCSKPNGRYYITNLDMIKYYGMSVYYVEFINMFVSTVKERKMLYIYAYYNSIIKKKKVENGYE